MESYRLLVGMSSPIKVPSKQRRRRELSSAKSLPGTLPSSQHALHKLDHMIPSPDQRAPSAPPIPPGKNLECKVRPFERLHCLAEGVKERGVPVHFTEAENLRFESYPPISHTLPIHCFLNRLLGSSSKHYYGNVFLQ